MDPLPALPEKTDQKSEKLPLSRLRFPVMLQLVHLKDLNREMISLFMNPLSTNSKTAARSCDLLEMCFSDLQETRDEKSVQGRQISNFSAPIVLPLRCTSD